MTPLSAASAPGAAAKAAAASAASSSASTGASGRASANPADRTFDDLLASMRAETGTEADASKKLTAGSDETEDRFLKLLVAQMKNQDPLNPLDNAQVTSQLAQINTVKGIDRLNDSLRKLVERSESGSATEAAALVGRRVLVEGDALELPKDGTAKAGFELSAPASSVRIEVLDDTGKVVDTRTRSNVPAGLQTFEWDGKAGSRTLEPGTYRLRVVAASGSEKVDATTLSATPVTAVVRGADGMTLQLGNGASKAMDEIRAVL